MPDCQATTKSLEALKGTMYEKVELKPVQQVESQHKEPVNRLTVVGTVYHQRPGEQPTAVPFQFTRSLEIDEQPYERHTTVSDFEWVKLDLGWLQGRVGTIVIANRDGGSQTNPTDEERVQLKQRVLLVGSPSTELGLFVIRDIVSPGEVAILTVLDPDALWIRSQRGSIMYTLWAFPR